MTILATLAFLFGVFLIFDGAVDRGLLTKILPEAWTTGATTIRISEIVTGGVLTIVLGLVFSSH